MNILDAAAFGRMIRARRHALGLQQRELALAANVGERFVVELEAGKASCQLGKALGVASALGLPLRLDQPAQQQGMEGGYDLPDLPLA